MNTPIAFFVFNRPETTARVFAEIRQIKPKSLFIIADAPRFNVPGDVNLCRAVLEIVSAVDWPCEVLTNFAEANMGCRQRVASGLDWVFFHVAEAIILEDDCLPHASFFRYCEELLDRFRDDENIKIISGNNYLFDTLKIHDSYYFSNMTHIWGWATWARAWNQYDSDMADWPELLTANWLSELFPDRGLRRYWERIFEFTYSGLINTWALRFNYSCLVNNGMAVVPCVNLVTNIGFGSDATTTQNPHRLANVPSEGMNFPLIHPKAMEINYQADRSVAKNIYFHPILPLFLAKIIERVKRKVIR